MDRLYCEVRNSAYEIIRRKGVTCYGIAMAVGRIAASIVKDEHAVLPISVVLEGQYGLEGLALSIPSLAPGRGCGRNPLGPARIRWPRSIPQIHCRRVPRQ